MDLKRKEDLEGLQFLNSLPYSDFNRLYGDAVFQEGEGNIISKMLKLIEKQSKGERPAENFVCDFGYIPDEKKM